MLPDSNKVCVIEDKHAYTNYNQMICDIAWLCKSILYFEQHTAVILTLLLFSCFRISLVWLQGLPSTTKAPPASQKWVKNKQAGGGLQPCKWVLLVKHNFVDEARAAVKTGLTNVEVGGEMEAQVCSKILVCNSAFVCTIGETTGRIW